MKHAHHTFRLTALCGCICAIAALGCASFTRVDTNEKATIELARTWTFLRHDPPLPRSAKGDAKDDAPGFTYRVTSPLRNAETLDDAIARYIELVLAQRGFEFVESDADLYLDYRLTLKPILESVQVAFTRDYVASHSYTPSYIIEGANLEKRRVEEMRLEIGVREKRGRVVWSGAYEETLKSRRKIPLEGHIGRLLSDLPERAK